MNNRNSTHHRDINSGVKQKHQQPRQDLINNKENNNGRVLSKTMNEYVQPAGLSIQQQQQNSNSSVIQQIFLLLSELKSQNQYLIERNNELEYVIERELKPKIEEGFQEIKSEIQAIKKQSIKQQSLKKIKKPILVNRSNVFRNMVKRRFTDNSSFIANLQKQDQQPTLTQQVITINNEAAYLQNADIDDYALQQDDGQQTSKDETKGTMQLDELQQTEILQVEEDSSTFVRKLEQTNMDPTNQEDDAMMRMSLGANLLQMMQFNSQQSAASKGGAVETKDQKQKKRRGIRNFNFRCNLQEIDKIIEEEDFGEDRVADYSGRKEESGIFNDTLQKIEEEQKNQLKSSFKKDQSFKTRQRPSTGITSQQSKPQRKGWGINPRKSLKGINTKSGQGSRPKTSHTNNALRLNRAPSSRQEHEDPILALLREEEDTIDNNNTPGHSNSEYNLQESTFEKTTPLSNIPQLDDNKSPSFSQQPPKKVVTPIHYKEAVPLSEIQQKIKKPAQQPLRIQRGMFKAPSTNLIESMLLEDDNEENGEKRVVEETKINNFFQKSNDKSKSRSRSKSNKRQKPMGRGIRAGIMLRNNNKHQKNNILELLQDDDDSDNDKPGNNKGTNDADENPFQSTSTLRT